MNKASLQQVIGKLESLFSKFNEHFYNGELQTPVITASPDVTRGAYGWCTGWKAWKGENAKNGGFYEINLCAEYLSRPFLDISETLLHEMVHLYNLQKEIKDTSRGGTYHNVKYKDAAEAHGLTVEKTKSGWSKTTLTEETAEWLKVEFGEETKFSLYREKMVKTKGTKKKSSSRKYVCPVCGTIIRATKEVRVICSECDEEFEEAI
jgi:rubrerythrin